MSQNKHVSLHLTPMQAGMLLVSTHSNYPDCYLQQLAGELEEEVNIPRLKSAWEGLVSRHAALRTHFHEEGDGLWAQYISPNPDAPFTVHDWREKPLDSCRSDFDAYLETDRNVGFKFEEEPPNRLTVFLFPDQHTRVLWTSHHSLLDGRSLTRLMMELWESYDGKDCGLPDDDDYATFIKQMTQKQNPDSQDFWHQFLKDFEEHDFSSYKSRTSSQNTVSRSNLSLDDSFSSELKRLLNSSAITGNTVSLGAWFLLVSCYTSASDLVVGTVRSCRYSLTASSRSVAGLGINTLPFRTQIEPNTKVSDWLASIRSDWIALRPHELTSLSEIRRWTQSSQSLFQTLHVHDRQTADQDSTGNNRRFRLINGRNESALSISTFEGEVFEADLQADPTLFDTDQLNELGQRYKHLVEQIVHQPDQPIQSIDWLNTNEAKRLIIDFNTPNDLPVISNSVFGAFKQQAELRHQQDALICEDGTLTYKELFDAAQSIQQEINQDPSTHPVGILLNDKAATVVSLFGILAADRCFVVLDPSYPEERLIHMVKDSQIKTLITLPEHKPQATAILQQANVNSRILLLDTDNKLAVEKIGTVNSSTSPKTTAPPTTEDWVYIVYTSGTTGNPKGVPITNNNLMPLMAWQKQHFDLGPETKTISTLSFTFDFGIQEIFTTLMFGGTLIIPPSSVLRRPEQFIDLLNSHKVSMVYAVPSFIEMILTAATPMPTLRVILLGGERLYWTLMDELNEQLHADCKVFNGYGPTEATINCAMCCIDGSSTRHGDSVPIGSLSGFSTLYILDSNGMPVPIEVPGELYIGGPGLSVGYLNQETLTADRFSNHVNSDNQEQRLYRTGDRVKWLTNGELEFLGRTDNQVKLNGYRIELEEIEAQLGKYPGLKSVAIKVESSSEEVKCLSAYVLPNDAHLDITELRKFARKQLPSHMIPSRFWQLEEMPLTRNGKIDRKRLIPPPVTQSEIVSDPTGRAPFEDWFYKVQWEKFSVQTTSDPQDPTGTNDPYLFLGNEFPERETLFHELQKRGQSATRIQPIDEAIQLADQIEELCKQFIQDQKLPGTLIYSYTPDPSANYESQDPKTPFHELLCILQTIGKFYRNRPLKLVVVTQNAQAVTTADLLHPEGALLHGLCKALPFEMPTMEWMSIDLDEQLSGISTKQFLALIAGAKSGEQFAFRNKQTFKWGSKKLEDTIDYSSSIREGGTYLITGGLGAIGQVIAKGIAEQARVNIGLLDRNEAVENFDEVRLSAIRSTGSQVQVEGADIGDKRQLAHAVQQLRNRFGKITGVIHTAGLVRPSIIQNLAPDQSNAVLDPKVRGTETLAKELLADSPDFVVLCSSIDAIRGSFNQADYCAANAFLDAFALNMRQQGRSFISINWDVWSDTGMAARTQVAGELQKARQEELALGISSEEGVKVLFHALAHNIPQIIVSTTPLTERIRQLGWTLKTATEQSLEELQESNTNQRSGLEETVYQIFTAVLDDETLSADDDFFQKGGNSISAMRIVSRLKKELGRNISISSIFEAPTISKMVHWLQET